MGEIFHASTVHLLSAFSASMLNAAGGTVLFLPITETAVRELVRELPVRSYVGHEGTASVLSARLGVEISASRERFAFAASGDLESVVLAQVVVPRLEPGRELSAEQVNALPVQWWQLNHCT